MAVTDHDRLVARRSKTWTALASVLFPPIGYVLVRRYALALLCLVTVGFLFTGFVIVPLHTRRLISRAQRRVDDEA